MGYSKSQFINGWPIIWIGQSIGQEVVIDWSRKGLVYTYSWTDLVP